MKVMIATRAALAIGLLALATAVSACSSAPGEAEREAAPQPAAAGSELQKFGIEKLTREEVAGGTAVKLIGASGAILWELTFAAPEPGAAHVHATWQGATFDVEGSRRSAQVISAEGRATATFDPQTRKVTWDGAAPATVTSSSTALAIVGLVGEKLTIAGPWRGENARTSGQVTEQTTCWSRCFQHCNAIYGDFGGFWGTLTGQWDACMSGCQAGCGGTGYEEPEL